METTNISEDVVSTRIVLLGSLTFLGVVFLLGLIVNIPAVVIYIRSRQVRVLTDKFILLVLIADLISLLVFIPLSFLFVLEFSANLNSSILKEDVGSPVQEERPLFLDTPNHAKLSEAGAPPQDDTFSSLCVQQWIFIVHKAVFIMATNLSVLAALKIVVERYLAVVAPLHYHKILKSSVIFFASIATFVISIICGVVMAIEPSEFSTKMMVSQCTSQFLKQSWSLVPMQSTFTASDLPEAEPLLNPMPGNSQSQESLHAHSVFMWWPVLKLVHATVFFIVPVITMIFMYLRIWTEARTQNARMAHHNKSPYVLPADVKKPETINVDGLQLIFGKFKLMQRLRRRARMDRAARVAILTVGLVFLCFGPLYYGQILTAIRSLMASYSSVTPQDGHRLQPEPLSQLRSLLAILLACLHPLLSPIVYVYRYKKVRSELKALLGKLISTMKCCKVDPTDCQDVVHQFNHLAQKLPSSSCVDVQQQMLESQSMSTADNDTSVTIDMRCAYAPGNVNDAVSADSTEICHTAHPMSRELCNCIQGELFIYTETDVESQEYRDQHAISVQSSNGLLTMISGWMNQYSRRWNQHRESVTSTASFVTLLSGRSRSIPSTDI